jgi:acyl carrier protein
MIKIDDVRAAVLDGIEAVLSKRMLLEDHDLFDDYGLDSLDRMSIMLEVEERLGLDFDGVDPADIGSIDDYFRLVQSRQAESQEVPAS